jgi:hypothetical protein
MSTSKNVEAVNIHTTKKASVGEMSLWDTEWAAEKATEALRYLGRYYPECLENLRVLDEHISRGEMVEKEINAMNERRARQKDPDGESELWQESLRAYEEKRRQMARLEWHAFHCGQAELHRATLQALIEHHEEQAAKLVEVKPKGDAA